MEKKRRFLRPYFLVLLAFLSSSPGLMNAVVWSGFSVIDVTDADLQLSASGGDIRMPAFPITVTAATVPVTITIINGDVTLEGSTIGGSCLSLIAVSGFPITLDFTVNPNDLTFLGSPDVALSPLFLFIQGTVNVKMNGGRTLTLGSDATHGGTQCYVMMQPTPLSALSFNRSDTSVPDTALDINVVIEANSVLSYAAAAGDTTSDGAISFCPANSGAGRFVLAINDLASFIVQGCTFTLQPEDCTTVDLSIPSGGIAQWNVNLATCPATGINQHFYLTVANSNAHYPQLLSDPFFTLGARAFPPFVGSFNGSLRYGAVIGANGVLHVDDNAYLDYVGLSNNLCPSINCIPNINCPQIELRAPLTPNCPCDNGTQQLIEPRNASALIIDGWFETTAAPAAILLGTQSGIFFRSGVDASGVIENPDHPFIYTIEPANMTPGSGEIVFDVEGPLTVLGSNAGDTYNSRMEILSLQVHQTVPMGPLFPDPGFVGPIIFPIRTFNVDSNDDYRQYNKAAWFINNVMSVTEASIAHTDELHLVCQSNDTISEATYLGGETWTLGAQMTPPFTPTIPRPNIEFFNSRLHLYTSAAFTGVDLAVPDLVVADVEFANLSKFIFYSNGRVIDNGTGRTLILGTLVGSQACDGCTVVSRDAHLNVMQTVDFTSVDPSVVPCKDEQLWFTTSTNTNLITEAIGSSDITGQTSIHEIYLGGNSNDSIGENVAPDCISEFTLSSTPSEWIAGNYFNFSTRGGSTGIPETSNVTGQGGIFVDLNGTFGIFPQYRASIATMVTKSCSNVACGPQIQLPKSQVVFANRVGVADWQLALEGPETIIIPAGQVYSDYTLDWVAITKDFIESGSEPAFIPYEIGNVNLCGCPPVIPANIIALPTVMGTVDQLQIVDSRIGDAASIMIDGGYVREMLWLSNCRPAEAPVAIVVLQNEGRLGFNTAHRNVDSINTETTLGVNGVTIIANGNGRIDLNDDMIINNVCAILQGPDWTADNVLEIRADASRAINVTPGGVLDLRSFTNGGTIRFAENVRVVFEAGSKLILGGGIVLEFTDDASFEAEAAPAAVQYFANLDATIGPVNNALNPLVTQSILVAHHQYAPLINYGTGIQNTDAFRIRIMGTGTLRFRDRSESFIGVGAFVGIESLFETLPGPIVCTIPTTDITLEILEDGQWVNGRGNHDIGGVLQVGNTVAHEGHSVSFTLTLNGLDAQFVDGAGGFFGLGAGVVRPAARGDSQSKVLADNLFNVDVVTFNFLSGSFSHSRIFSSDNTDSHSMVIGSVGSFTTNYTFVNPDDPVILREDNMGIYGGGNFFLLNSPTETNVGALALFDRADQSDDIIQIPVTGGPSVTGSRLQASLLASTDMLLNADIAGMSPLVFYQAYKALSATNVVSRSLGKSMIAPFDDLQFRESRTSGLLGYVDRGFIGRQSVSDIVDSQGASAGDRRARAYDIGTVKVQINTALAAPAPVLIATQIQE